MTGKLQREHLDRGSAAGMSVTDGCFIRQNPSLAEQFAQLSCRLEPSVFCQQLFPVQMDSVWNVPAPFRANLFARKFTPAASINNLHFASLQ